MAGLVELNERMFRELDRLEAAEGEDLENEIARAKAIETMCGRVIDSTNAAIRMASLQQTAMDDVAMNGVTGRMLGGGE